MNMHPPIVINAYQRPQSLKRLLLSLDQAIIPDQVDIIFSLEAGAAAGVKDLTNSFDWKYGNKKVIQHEEKRGLIGHFIFCGNLSQEFGGIVYLEDDLFVGPFFYHYALEALNHYANEPMLAGFSLNCLWFNGYLHTPFKPLDDGNSCFFLQVPWYQGQVYSAQQWADFETWYKQRKDIPPDLMIHDAFRNFPNDDWFPIKTQYLIENGKYYAFPRISHCVNFGDAGTHFITKTNFFQTELAMGLGNQTFNLFDKCLAVYDSFYELDPDRLKQLAPELKDIELTVDFNGSKKLTLIKSRFILTSRTSTKPIQQYALEMRPPELNVSYKIEGDFFTLSEVQHVKDKTTAFNFNTLFNYHYRFKRQRKLTLKLILQLIRSLW